MKLTMLLLSLSLFANAARKESGLGGTYKITATKPDGTCSKKEAYLELTFKCPAGTCAKIKIWFKRNGGKTNFVKINAKTLYARMRELRAVYALDFEPGEKKYVSFIQNRDVGCSSSRCQRSAYFVWRRW